MTKRSNVYRLFSRPNTVRAREVVVLDPLLEELVRRGDEEDRAFPRDVSQRTQPRLEHLLAHLAPQLGEDLFPGLRGHGAIPRRRCFIDGKVAEKRSVPGRFARRKRKSCQHVIPQVWITLNPL